MKAFQCLILTTSLALAACNRNTAIGNDREAHLEPPATASPIEPAALALENVAAAVVKPQTMSDADVAAIGGTEGRCVFTLTEVGFPTFVYQPGGQGFLKLNGKLIPLEAAGEGRYAGGELLVVTRMLDDRGGAGKRSSEIIVVPPGAGDELGYRGYVSCAEAT